MKTFYKKWQWKPLLLAHLIIALLLTSFFFPTTALYWKKIDVAVFRFLNNSLEGRDTWQLFWAFANHKNADWIEDAIILCFSFFYIRQATKEQQNRRKAEILFSILFAFIVVFLVSKSLVGRWMDIHRLSPTCVLDECIRLSKEIPWLHIKDKSQHSFPGDHGVTALYFASTFYYLGGWRFGLWASLYAGFLCIPRMIAGAHWFSDIVVGAGSIVIFCNSLVFYTPFQHHCVNKIETLFNFFKRKKIPQSV